MRNVTRALVLGLLVFGTSSTVLAHGGNRSFIGTFFNTRVGQYGAAVGPRFSFRGKGHELDLLAGMAFNSPQNSLFAVLDYGYVLYNKELSKKFSLGLEFHFELEYFYSGLEQFTQSNHTLEISPGLVFFSFFEPTHCLGLVTKVGVSWSPLYVHVSEGAFHPMRIGVIGKMSLFIEQSEHFYIVPEALFRFVVGTPKEPFALFSVSLLYKI